MAERLLQIALDPNTKNYADVSICEAVFAIIERFHRQENAEQLQAIKDSLNGIKDGKVIDIEEFVYRSKNPKTLAI